MRLVADEDRERSDTGTVNTCINVFSLHAKPLTPDLLFLGAAGSQNITKYGST